jgi:hypothetical protein
MSDGSKWLYRRCLGNTGECRGKRGYHSSCALKALPIQDGHVGTSGLGTGGVLLWRAVLGTGGVAAVSPW